MAPHPRYHKKTLIQDISKGGLKLCHFESKVKAPKLSWVKRLYLSTNETWTFLPQHFYSCNNLDIFFRGCLALKTNTQIPKFYSDIHDIYIKNFLEEPVDTTQILK